MGVVFFFSCAALIQYEFITFYGGLTDSRVNLKNGFNCKGVSHNNNNISEHKDKQMYFAFYHIHYHLLDITFHFHWSHDSTL